MQEQPSATDIAWAAGLFEGEGTLNNYPRRTKQGIQVRLAMSDQDVVERFAHIVGVGSVRYDVRTGDPAYYKPICEWYVYAAPDVLRVIEMLLPYLGERRAKRARQVQAVAELVLPYGESRTHCRRGHPYEGDNVIVETSGIRRCRICRTTETRERMRKKLGITPDRYRIKE